MVLALEAGNTLVVWRMRPAEPSFPVEMSPSVQDLRLSQGFLQAANARAIVIGGLSRVLSCIDGTSVARNIHICSALLLLGVEESEARDRRLTKLEGLIYPRNFELSLLVQTVRRIRSLVDASGNPRRISEALAIWGKSPSDDLCIAVLNREVNEKEAGLRLARECMGHQGLKMANVHTAIARENNWSETRLSSLLDSIGGLRMHLNDVLHDRVSAAERLHIWRGGLLSAVYAARAANRELGFVDQYNIYDCLVTSSNRVAWGYEHWREGGEPAVATLRAIFPELESVPREKFHDLANKSGGIQTDARKIELTREGYRALLSSIGIEMSPANLRKALADAGVSEKK